MDIHACSMNGNEEYIFVVRYTYVRVYDQHNLNWVLVFLCVFLSSGHITENYTHGSAANKDEMTKLAIENVKECVEKECSSLKDQTIQKDEKEDVDGEDMGDEDDDDLNELDDLEHDYMDEDLLSLDSYYSGKIFTISCVRF